MKPKWDDLPAQEQVKYEELMYKHFPTADPKELEERAKKYYESLENPA